MAPMSTRPLSEWIRQKSFDSAEKCEQLRVSLIGTSMNRTSLAALYTRNAAVEGKCLPSDVPANYAKQEESQRSPVQLVYSRDHTGEICTIFVKDCRN